MTSSRLHRWLGGSPPLVALRLVVLCVVVGALLAWLDIDAGALLDQAVAAARRLWSTGFAAVFALWRYFLAGAVVVLPLWLLSRLFSRPPAAPAPGTRWPDPPPRA